ncbi:hypothetical protein [Nocardioides sp.]|uniref:hypothetical protein n=1 Tax=Nocardioides sp. TaxID=35761 RepID=UPI003D0BCDF2
MKMLRTRTRLAALALISLGALSGCGGLHPGLAAVVGDSTISNNDVDSLGRDLCTVVTSSPEQQTTAFPRSTALEAVVQRFVMRSIADQMGEEYDVSASSTYDADVDAAKQQFSYVDPEVLDRVLDLLVADRYFNDVLTSIGKEALVAEGASQPTAEDQLAKGVQLAQVWETTHDVAINPRFPSLSLGDTSFTQTPDQTSVAVSDFARQAAKTPPDAEWIAGLPAAQRCG